MSKRHGVFASMSVLLLLGGCGTELEQAEEVNPSAAEAASMPGCGTALATFDGSTAFSNGGNTGTGVSCGGTGAYGYQYQCVELVMRHFKTHWGLRWYGNAKDLLVNAPRDQVDVIQNGASGRAPVPGDMLVWPNGTYGHVALITAVRPGAVDIIEQNVSGNGKATLSWDGRSIGARWGSWTPAGWAHARANGGGGGVSWSCANSSYQGRQFWTCSGGNIYRCQDNVPVMTRCAAGCVSRPLGTDDTCR